MHVLKCKFGMACVILETNSSANVRITLRSLAHHHTGTDEFVFISEVSPDGRHHCLTSAPTIPFPPFSTLGYQDRSKDLSLAIRELL